MARFLAFKQFNSLRPADEGGEAMLRKLKQGELVRVEYSRPRNIQHHRLFWALMSVVHDNLDHENYPTVEDLAAAVKISAGHRTRIQLPNGEAGFIPQSIKFHKMDQNEFSAFYERVCDVIAKHFLPEVTSEELREEVEIMIGISGEARSPAGQGAAMTSESVTGTGRPLLSDRTVVQELRDQWDRGYNQFQSTDASGDMGGDTPSEASVVVSGASPSPDAGAGESDPQSAPPPANYSAPAWGNNSSLGRMGNASGTSAPVAGGDEARADVGPLPPSVGSPSPIYQENDPTDEQLLAASRRPNLFEQYWDAIRGARYSSELESLHHRFWAPRLPVHNWREIAPKIERLKTIRLNMFSGIYQTAEGEEKAKAAIESCGEAI